MVKLFVTPISQFLKKGIGKGKFKPSDVLECLQNLTNNVDDFWIKVAGKIPTRDEERGRKMMNIALGSCMKYIYIFCESMKPSDYNKR